MQSLRGIIRFSQSHREVKGKGSLNHKVPTLHQGLPAFSCVINKRVPLLYPPEEPLSQNLILSLKAHYPALPHKKKKKTNLAKRTVPLNSRCPLRSRTIPRQSSPSGLECWACAAFLGPAEEQRAWHLLCLGRGQGQRLRRNLGPRSVLTQDGFHPTLTHAPGGKPEANSDSGQSNARVAAGGSAVPTVMGQLLAWPSQPCHCVSTGPVSKLTGVASWWQGRGDSHLWIRNDCFPACELTPPWRDQSQNLAFVAVWLWSRYLSLRASIQNTEWRLPIAARGAAASQMRWSMSPVLRLSISGNDKYIIAPLGLVQALSSL